MFSIDANKHFANCTTLKTLSINGSHSDSFLVVNLLRSLIKNVQRFGRFCCQHFSELLSLLESLCNKTNFTTCSTIVRKWVIHQHESNDQNFEGRRRRRRGRRRRRRKKKKKKKKKKSGWLEGCSTTSELFSVVNSQLPLCCKYFATFNSIKPRAG